MMTSDARKRLAESAPTPIRPAPVVYSEMGAAWIERGDLGIYLEPAEIPAIVAALLVELERLGDAL